MILIHSNNFEYTGRDSIRKARSAFLVQRGNTLEPSGLYFIILFYSFFISVISVFLHFLFLLALHIT